MDIIINSNVHEGHPSQYYSLVNRFDSTSFWNWFDSPHDSISFFFQKWIDSSNDSSDYEKCDSMRLMIQAKIIWFVFDSWLKSESFTSLTPELKPRWLLSCCAKMLATCRHINQCPVAYQANWRFLRVTEKVWHVLAEGGCWSVRADPGGGPRAARAGHVHYTQDAHQTHQGRTFSR